MKTYRRASAAFEAAGNNPVLIVKVGKERLYIVGDLDPLDGIELLSAPSAKYGSRAIHGQIILGHLDRLGNANGAAAAEYRRGDRIWPDRWGMAEKFINPAHEAQFEQDRAARNPRETIRLPD